MNYFTSITILGTIFVSNVCCTELWKEWWGYDGFSGPQFWGKHLVRWALCGNGKYQSPIDINTERLMYDPNLEPIIYNATKVNGTFVNTGLDLTLELNESEADAYVRFTAGPFSYTYRVYNIKLHFGAVNEVGSEHTIGKKQFPLELQIMGFNEDLYSNHKEAMTSTHGLAIVAVLGAIDDVINPEFDRLISAVNLMSQADGGQSLKDLSILKMIPPSHMYITYEGSLTQPSCQETVTWAIVNKPLRITKEQMSTLRMLYHYNEKRTTLASNNFRPPLPVNRRPIRTNIPPLSENEDCAIRIRTSYKVNRRLIDL